MMFKIKQYIKMFLQNVLLPLLYLRYSHAPVRKGSVIFADAHHEHMPFSMQNVYKAVCARGHEPQLFIADFGKLSFGGKLSFLVRFMKQYATAEYVFVCDYFLPAASCRKRPETTLTQLWHSCGLMKKIAFDTGEDIPKNYRGNMFGNYTWLTLSAPVCVPVHARALHMEETKIRATGISRTDAYFDESWNENCRKHFYTQYPDAKGKKVILWAPTFRGNAAAPTLAGLEAIRRLSRERKGDWYVIIKAHPHVDAHQRVSNCEIPTEELFAVTDLLITDYSSVLFDFLLYRKPILLFAPDLKQYEEKRGFYLDYRSIPYPIAEDEARLEKVVSSSLDQQNENRLECSNSIREEKSVQETFRETYVGACDGHSTERILELVGI